MYKNTPGKNIRGFFKHMKKTQKIYKQESKYKNIKELNTAKSIMN
jgi:hypothetical protein